MNSVEALNFAILRLQVDRGRFVHVEDHNAALATLMAMREVLNDQQRATRAAAEAFQASRRQP